METAANVVSRRNLKLKGFLLPFAVFSAVLSHNTFRGA